MLIDAGRKAEAKIAINDFIASFSASDDRRQWVRKFLEGRYYDYKIRHELYEQIIFPVLLEGFNQDDSWSKLWLAKTMLNLADCRDLVSQIEGYTIAELLLDVYAVDPSEEVRQLLITEYIRGFDYSQHEWPAGILNGPNVTTIADCEEMLRDVAIVRSIDRGEHEAYLQQYKARVKKYIVRLRNRILEGDEND